MNSLLPRTIRQYRSHGSASPSGREQAEAEIDLGLRGRAAQCDGVESMNPGAIVPRLLTRHPGGQGAGLVGDERVVHEEEGLRGHDRLASTVDDRAGVGAIEEAAEVGRAGPGPRGGEVKRPPRHAQVREGRAARGGVQATGHDQQAIADGLRIEAAAAHPAEEAVLRVRGGQAVDGPAALLVGRGQHDEPVHRLDRPARIHESRGEMVEQLGMRRPFPARAEVVGSADQALAEVVLPDPVDHDAGRQRMIGTRQPVGQLPTAAPLGDRLPMLARQDPREAARDGLAELLGVPSEEDLGRP